MQYNISPETIVKDQRSGLPIKMELNLEELIQKTCNTSQAHQMNVALASSGYCFRKNEKGILPYLCESFYSERKSMKKIYLKNQSEHEKVVIELRKRGLI